MKIPMDQHGQPINRLYSTARLSDRKMDELIGLCRGMVADKAATQDEAEFLQNWIKNNSQISHLWPASELLKRLDRMLKDRFLDSEEKKELLETLYQLTGETAAKNDAKTLSIKLPFEEHLSGITFPDHNFCLTGKFVVGTRKQCEDIVIKRNGDLRPSPTKDTDYLIIGTVGSSDWIHSSFGRKIEKAVDLREKKNRIKIIPEEHWAKFI